MKQKRGGRFWSYLNEHRKFRNTLFVILGILALLILTGIYHAYLKPLPAGTNIEGNIYYVNEENVEFLYDTAYYDENDELQFDQEIFDKVFEVIDNAESFILIDFFLVGNDQEDIPRFLAEELTQHLVNKKRQNPDMVINFVTDEFNTRYWSYDHPQFRKLQNNGINVVYTDMTVMRDSNPMYSSLWRVFFQWFGIPKNYDCEDSWYKPRGKYYCIRSLLRMTNAKANHRKIVMADVKEGDETKIVTILGSANPDNYGSGYSNTALKFEGGPYLDIYNGEKAISEFSPGSFEDIKMPAYENNGDVSLQIFTEGKIRDAIVDEINNAQEGESINIVSFLITERDVIHALINAAERGVKIEIVADPSNNLFGRDSKGIPNNPAVNELVKKGKGMITARWYVTGRHQFHSKMVVIKKANGKVIMFIGSANLTKRNIGTLNIEIVVKAVADSDAEFITRFYDYFDRIWNNKDGKRYTSDFDSYSSSFLQYIQYLFQESSGLSAF